MFDLIDRADAFARRAHAGQKRKYTGEPYIVHPLAVAALVRSVPHSLTMVAAALLHDVIEDCGVIKAELAQAFGPRVAELVYEVTDQATRALGNRAARKAWEAQRLSRASREAKTIKLADLIDNTPSIVANDPSFAVVYLAETEQLLPALAGGDARLHARARKLLADSRTRLDQIAAVA